MAVSLAMILDTTRRGLPALAARRRELERAAERRAAAPDFAAALRRPSLALIAEVKRRSPSAGSLLESLDPASRATLYADAGAAAISVLTDGPFFGGSLDDLEAVSAAVRVPALRKDFILAEEQLLEARAAGASAALLIVRALAARRLAELRQFAEAIGLAALLEVHSARELQVACEAGARIIGVNSRDLDTFRIDTDAAWALLEEVPADLVAVAESGMAEAADVRRAAEAGADAVLVGTALSRADDPRALVGTLSGVARRGR
ncbi:MAG: indole-3-glycerol phosphate synthase TrpC [Gemmatimonadales bacterium]|nr:indole-3-glycerol phosphate synthase TrpC [Gemmatimonadales bacterium]